MFPGSGNLTIWKPENLVKALKFVAMVLSHREPIHVSK